MPSCSRRREMNEPIRGWLAGKDGDIAAALVPDWMAQISNSPPRQDVLDFPEI